MYHVGLITKSGEILGKDFQTRPEADEWILNIDIEKGVKRADIRNDETNEREKIEF